MWYVYRFCRCCCHGANLHREPVFPCKKSEETPHKVCTKECKTDCVQRSRNERSFFMQTEKTRHLRTRVISVLLAVLMIVTCLPSMLFPVSADSNGRSGGPLVLTNASVEFRDSKYKSIDEVNTGDVFYLMSTISGNNVNEGEVDSYRIEITDKNLLLPNFAGNGFRDGAVYNGYTLHVNSDGSRYIAFDIDNGQTKQVRLQAKFQNGKTPGGTTSTVKIVQDSTGKNASSTITAKAKRQWSASKSEDRNALTAAQLAAGTTVNYTLSASANNASKKNGVEWVQSLKFEDTISLSEMTFTGGAQTAVENAVKSAVAAAGYTAGNLSVTVSGSTAKISFTVDSKNTNAEMSAVNLNVALPLNSSTVKMNGTADGKVTNSLTVSGKPYGDNASYSTIGGNSVELKVSAPQGPKFSIGKTVKNGKAYYVNGDTVEFEISASNTGDAAGDITLTDNVPDGMTLQSITTADGTVSGNSVTFQNVAAGATVTAKVVCKVSKDQTANLTNEVTDGKNTAKATISVKEDKTVIETPMKSGYVTYNGKNLGQKYYPGMAGQIATYTISVTNSGAKDAKDVPVADDNLSSKLENITYKVDGVTKSAFPNEIDVPAGKTVQITVTGTIKSSVTGEISNVAKVDDKSSNKVKFTPDTPKAQLGITKTADVGNYTFGTAEDVVYTITVTNNGEADAENVKIEDILPNDMAFRENSGVYGVLTLADGTTKDITTVDTKTLTAGGTITVPKGESITLTVYANVEDSAIAAALTNTAKVYEGAEVKGTATHTIYGGEDLSKYSLQKKIIAVNGIPADDTTEIVNGDKLTYQATFTNNGTTTMENLYLYDYGTTLKWEASDVLKVVAINGNASDSRIQTVTVEQNKIDGGGYAVETFNIMGINLAAGESVTVEYVVLGNDVTNTNNDYASEKRGIQGYGDGTNLNNSALMQTLSAFETKFGTQRGVYNYTAVGGLTVNEHGNKTVTWYAHDMILNPVSNTVFEAKKSLTNSADKTTNIVDKTAAELEQKTFSYSLALSGSNNDYAGKKIVVEDTLPDGMEYVLDSVEGTANSTALSGIQATQVGQTLTFTFVSTEKFAYQYGGGVKLTYQAKLTADKAQELANSTAKKVTLTNTLSKVTVVEGKNDGSDRVISPEDKVDISFTKTTPAPGFAKLAVASFAGQTYDDTAVQPVGNGYITAGDTLIWQTVLYNGRGNSTDVADLKLDGVTLTDNLPATYQFNNGTGLKMTYQVLNLTHNGDGSSTFETDTNGLLKNGTPVSENDGVYEIKDNGTKLVIHADKLATKLEKNKCIVFQFATTVKDGQESEGVITNTGYATIDQPFSAEDTVAGEKQDNQIWSYANYNIVGLTTESWKTITYKNNGHNGTPHTDPATDTGYSRQPTHNYVQGMQGEDVTYELHIKNNSPVDLENMTIIDRLPYVGDLGLVSGYERFSAFGVKLKSIDSVMVGGTDATANAAYSYSTDKTSVLNEYSKDWLGQNDVMNWTSGDLSVAPPADTVDFRIQLQDTTVKVGEEVVVKVTATVPSYVAKTGEENIAWNSFAYSYQNKSILGDTVMVAEPAKVGVWVQTPDTTVDVTVNKTLTATETKDATFYFALFTDENYTTRLSDVISVTIPAGKTAASVTMKDVDLSSIKQQTNNANNVYLLETDAKGNQIRNYTPAYKDKDNVISTDATTNQTVDVTNTKNTGDITLTKTLAGVEGGNVTGDTFYFALFTENAAGDYVRYEEAPVQSLTFTEADSKKVTFENVPKGMDFYVLETNANGVLADTDFAKYTSDSGIRYTSEPAAPAAVQADGKTEITNTEEIDYSITVSKVLIADDVKSTPAFSVGLFTENDTLVEKKTVVAGADVTFDNLKADTPYYIFELNDADEQIANGASFQMPVVLDPKNSTTKTDTTFYVSYDCCDDDSKVAALTLTKDAPQANTIITNTTKNPAQIKVTKIATEDGKPAVDHAIKVGLFTLNADGSYEPVKDATGTAKVEPITIAAGDKGKKSVTFDGLDSSKTYYVFELDADGKRVENDSTTTVKSAGSSKTFLATYSGNSSRLDLLPGIPGEKVITDANTTQVELSFAKTDVKGNAMAGCEMTLTGPNGYSKTWTSDTGSKKFTGLAEGEYTLTEKPMTGYAPVSISFTVNAAGYIVTTDAQGNPINGSNFSLTENGLTVINRSQISVSKKDIASLKELAGAKITITKTDGSWNEALVELSRTGTTFTKSDSVDDESQYQLTSKELTFISDGKNKTDITGLPDGTYTMTEVVAPDGYNKVSTDFTFTIKNGVVDATGTTEYDVSGNDITMKDGQKPSVTISKQAVGGGEELTGAVLKLTAPAGTDLSKVKGSYSDGSTAGIETSGNTITWTSDKAKGGVTLENLPAGVYTLEETTAPDGFTKKTEEMTFEVGTDGKVGTVNGLTKDDNKVVMEDAASKLTIAKKDITGQQEVTGAKLTLTLTNPDESGATLDGVTANIRVDSRTADSITWTSGKTDAILSKLPDGTYTLGESGDAFTDTETGKTYTVIESTMTFTVKNGVVTSTTGDADKLNDKATEGYYYYDKTKEEILVCDAEAVNVVSISKQDAGSGAEVAGATLEITAENVLDTTKLELSRTDKNGNKTVLVKGTDYSISTDGKTIQFVSGEDATTITGLPAGTYKLKETNAPDGYQLYTAEETFTIGTDGKVTGTTTIQDEVSKLTIAKKDITGKQEVTGAKLTLKLTKPDESGATLDGVAANIRVDSRTADSITWTSGKTDAILSKLPDGKYTLKETGDAFTDAETKKTYTVIESTMTFTVENGVVTDTTGDADNLNDKATKGYYYYDKTAGQILVCDAEQPAITTTSTSETTTTTTTTTSTSESSTTSDTETTTGTGTVTTVSTVTTTSKTSGTTTEVTTDTTLATSGNTTETSAGPTTTSTSETTTEVTTGTTLATSGNTTETSAGPTTTSTSETTTEVTTGTTLATSGSTTETSAGPTTTSTSETTTEVTTGTTLATSGNTTETSAGPTTTSTSETTTEVTTDTTLATSGSTTETSAGPTTTSTNGTTTDTTTAKTTVTTASASTETSAASTTTTAAGTTAETVTETSTTAASTVTTAETTVTTAATTTIEATTTTTEETTVETTTEETTEATTTTEETTTTIVTTTEQPDGYVIRKCDVGGNEIGGASLNITDQSGNVIDQWVSEEGVSHVFAGIQPNTPYCLTETLAPADYLVAEPIYFQLNEDGTLVLFVGVSLNEDGSWSVENAVVTANPDGRAIVMIDEYVGTETTTTETTEETTTTTEATTTTAKNTTAGNGEHTPSVSTTTTASTETTTVTGESGTGTTAGSGGSGTTTAAGGSQTTTVIRSSSGSSSSSSRSNTKISSTPKTGEALPVVIIPAGIALAAAIVAGCKRKKK